MNYKKVVKVNPNDLLENELALNFYSIPENYETIKENIAIQGILEPLIVRGNKVVSGNLRLRIAKELGFDSVPVIYKLAPEDDPQLEVVSHSQQRRKKYSEILNEYEILAKHHPVGKGCRTDLIKQKKKNKEILVENAGSESMMKYLRKLKTLAVELYGENSEQYKQIWRDVDSLKTRPTRAVKNLERLKAVRHNNQVIPQHFDFISNKASIYNKSCEKMVELKDNSVACLFMSPPYFQMKDYGTGEFQRGMEDSIGRYIANTIKDLSDCKRVLKDDGSLWVNINEPCIDGEYHCISHQFVLEMKKQGWIFNDEWIWIKNNANFTQAKRACRSHEYIFHFVKLKNYYYDISWMENLSDPDNLISVGTSKKVSNLLSGMDFRECIVRTNGNNMSDLRKACKEQGFTLTHNAAFPITIPLISILTTSKPEDIIVDCYSGTSTTGEAALMTGRRFTGYEVKAEFVKASEVRLKKYVNSHTNYNRSTNSVYVNFSKSQKSFSQFVEIDSLTFDDSTKITLEKIKTVESEIDLNSIKPIKVDMQGRIIEGLDRYLVLIKLGIDEVPIIKDNKRNKIYLYNAAFSKESYMLAA